MSQRRIHLVKAIDTKGGDGIGDGIGRTECRVAVINPNLKDFQLL